MIGAFDAPIWTGAAIALAVAVGVIRLLLWRRSAPTSARGPSWRLAVLIALQAAAGILFYLVLFPPSVALRSGVLVVATRGAPATLATAQGEIMVALPEAGKMQNAERVPDLATALRRHPGVRRIRVEGDGLPPRDQAASPIPLDFDPPPRPRGLIDIALPDWSTPGSTVSVGGQVGTLAVGSVELADPANVVVDRARVAAGQRFVLKATTRAVGLALFTVRLRDASGAVIEQIAVPVEARDQAQPRVLVVAGAPSAESKYLRRWAEDAGIDLSVDIDVGAGVQLGDEPVPLTPMALADVDLMVVDDRRWESFDPGTREALTSAIEGGLGLLLRPTGPLSATTRRDWAVLGLPVTGGNAARALRLDGPAPAPSVEREFDAALPELAGREIDHEGPRAVSLLRDASGAALASWRSRGNGRIGLWTVTDSYVLVLAGRPDRYGDMWSALFSALARPSEDRGPRVTGFAREGERVAICRLTGPASVIGPDGATRALLVDPLSGEQSCAGYWPSRSGWSLVRDGQGRETAFYIQPAGAAPSLRRSADREATLAIAGAADAARSATSPLWAPGSPWPWLPLLLAASAGLWWLERRRFPQPDRTGA